MITHAAEDERKFSLTISTLADLVVSLPLGSQLTRCWRYPMWSSDLLRSFPGWYTEFGGLRELGSEVSRSAGNSWPTEKIRPMRRSGSRPCDRRGSRRIPKFLFRTCVFVAYCYVSNVRKSVSIHTLTNQNQPLSTCRQSTTF